jgi:hypothetical protein
MTIWVGAGFAGLLGVLSLDVVEAGPRLLQRLALTLIVIGAGSLARARVGFEWAATILERYVEDRKAAPGDPYPYADTWPREHERFWTVALWCMIITAVLVLLAAWWPSAA